MLMCKSEAKKSVFISRVAQDRSAGDASSLGTAPWFGQFGWSYVARAAVLKTMFQPNATTYVFYCLTSSPFTLFSLKAGMKNIHGLSLPKYTSKKGIWPLK